MTRPTDGSLDRYQPLVDDWEAFCEASRRREPTVFRIRTGRVEPDQLLARLREQGFRTRPVEGLDHVHQVVDEPYAVTFTPEHWAGLLYVQQASTAVAAPALDPRPGDRVLDLCAAPGGKTSHLADLLEDTGCVVANDVSEGRIRGLLGNLYRLGHTNVLVTASDGRRFPEDALFDRVLVDAPCTGEGTLRRRGGDPPEQSRGFLDFVTSAQDELLRKAIRVTRPGGTILYVTCTFAPEENEAVVDAVLADEPVTLEALDLPIPHAPGITSFEGRSFRPELEGAARIYPHHLDSGGLFLARLRKEGEATKATADGWSPVPLRFPGDDATEGEAGELVRLAQRTLRDYYDLDPAVLDEVGWLLRGGRLWLHTLDAWPVQGWAPGSWRTISAGFRAMEFDDRGRSRPTNDVLQWLGSRLRRSVAELDDTEVDRLLDTGLLPSREELMGLVAFRWRDVVLGRGACTDDGIRSAVPKARAARLARSREVMREAAGD